MSSKNQYPKTGLLSQLFSFLSRLFSRSTSEKKSTTPPPTKSGLNVKVVWGADEKVSQQLLDSLAWTCIKLMPNRSLSDMMSEMLSCMAFESAYTFSPSVQNDRSKATGLIQFMPSTARSLGTSTDSLSRMTQAEQMAFVYNYFQPYAGRLHNLGDIYLAIFYPAAMNKPDDWVIAHRPDVATGKSVYEQNRGLDRGGKGYITRADAVHAVTEAYNRGRSKTFTGEVYPFH